MDRHSVLTVDTAHFNQVAIVSTVAGDELGNYGQRLGGVDFVICSGAVESLVAHTEGSEITTVFVALSLVSIEIWHFLVFKNEGINNLNKIPVTRSVVSARDTSALLLLTGGARMGSESLAEFVGLPNVEFSAARTVFSSTGINCLFSFVMKYS